MESPHRFLLVALILVSSNIHSVQAQAGTHTSFNVQHIGFSYAILKRKKCEWPIFFFFFEQVLYILPYLYLNILELFYLHFHFDIIQIKLPSVNSSTGKDSQIKS